MYCYGSRKPGTDTQVPLMVSLSNHVVRNISSCDTLGMSDLSLFSQKNSPPASA